METLAIILIIILLGVEVWCGYRFKVLMKERSEKKAEERRAATRPKAYKAVRESWAIYRNRRSLWENLKK